MGKVIQVGGLDPQGKSRIGRSLNDFGKFLKTDSAKRGREIIAEDEFQVWPDAEDVPAEAWLDLKTVQLPDGRVIGLNGDFDISEIGLDENDNITSDPAEIRASVVDLMNPQVLKDDFAPDQKLRVASLNDPDKETADHLVFTFTAREWQVLTAEEKQSVVSILDTALSKSPAQLMRENDISGRFNDQKAKLEAEGGAKFFAPEGKRTAVISPIHDNSGNMHIHAWVSRFAVDTNKNEMSASWRMDRDGITNSLLMPYLNHKFKELGLDAKVKFTFDGRDTLETLEQNESLKEQVAEAGGIIPEPVKVDEETGKTVAVPRSVDQALIAREIDRVAREQSKRDQEYEAEKAKAAERLASLTHSLEAVRAKEEAEKAREIAENQAKELAEKVTGQEKEIGSLILSKTAEEARANSAEAKLEETTTELSKTSKELSSKSEKLADITKLFDELKEKNGELVQANITLEQENKGQASTIGRMTSELVSTKSYLESVKDDLTTEQQARKTAEQLAKDRLETLEERESEIDELTGKLKSEQEARANAEKLAEDRASELTKMREELNSKDKLISEKDSQIKQVVDKIKELAEANERITKSLEAFKERALKAEGKAEVLEKTTKTLTTERDDAFQKGKAEGSLITREQLTPVVTENTQLKSEIARLREELENAIRGNQPKNRGPEPS